MSENLVVRTTNDYALFKTLVGNREVSDIQVKKLIKSIKKNGYNGSPIIVNENYEVVDGQGRLEALKTLGKSVPFLVIEGSDINDCITMNLNSTNWTAMDYAKSYAHRGNENYVRLLQLVDEYNSLGFRVVFQVVQIANCCAVNDNGDYCGKISSENFVLNESDMLRLRSHLNYLLKYDDYLGKKRKTSLYAVLIWALENVSFDKERLYRKFVEKMPIGTPPPPSKKECIEFIQRIYNENLLAKNRVYFTAEYEKTKMRTWR